MQFKFTRILLFTIQWSINRKFAGIFFLYFENLLAADGDSPTTPLVKHKDDVIIMTQTLYLFVTTRRCENKRKVTISALPISNSLSSSETCQIHSFVRTLDRAQTDSNYPTMALEVLHNRRKTATGMQYYTVIIKTCVSYCLWLLTGGWQIGDTPNLQIQFNCIFQCLPFNLVHWTNFFSLSPIFSKFDVNNKEFNEMEKYRQFDTNFSNKDFLIKKKLIDVSNFSK